MLETVIWVSVGVTIEVCEWVHDRYEEWKLRRKIRRFVKAGLRMGDYE